MGPRGFFWTPGDSLGLLANPEKFLLLHGTPCISWRTPRASKGLLGTTETFGETWGILGTNVDSSGLLGTPDGYGKSWEDPRDY